MACTSPTATAHAVYEMNEGATRPVRQIIVKVRAAAALRQR